MLGGQNKRGCIVFFQPVVQGNDKWYDLLASKTRNCGRPPRHQALLSNLLSYNIKLMKHYEKGSSDLHIKYKPS